MENSSYSFGCFGVNKRRHGDKMTGLEALMFEFVMPSKLESIENPLYGWPMGERGEKTNL